MSRFTYVRLQDPDPEETDLAILKLQSRIYNQLYLNGLRTVEELLGLTEEELKNLRQIGEGSIREIRAKMCNYLINSKSNRPFPRPASEIDPLRVNAFGVCVSSAPPKKLNPLKQDIGKLDLSYNISSDFRDHGIKTIDQLAVLTEKELKSISKPIRKTYLGIVSKVRVYFLENGIRCNFPAKESEIIDPALKDRTILEIIAEIEEKL